MFIISIIVLMYPEQYCSIKLARSISLYYDINLILSFYSIPPLSFGSSKY